MRVPFPASGATWEGTWKAVRRSQPSGDMTRAHTVGRSARDEVGRRNSNRLENVPPFGALACRRSAQPWRGLGRQGVLVSESAFRRGRCGLGRTRDVRRGEHKTGKLAMSAATRLGRKPCGGHSLARRSYRSDMRRGSWRCCMEPLSASASGGWPEPRGVCCSGAGCMYAFELQVEEDGDNARKGGASCRAAGHW